MIKWVSGFLFTFHLKHNQIDHESAVIYNTNTNSDGHLSRPLSGEPGALKVQMKHTHTHKWNEKADG